jgi:hypothetical protein
MKNKRPKKTNEMNQPQSPTPSLEKRKAQLIHDYGEFVLNEIAYKLHSQCPRPFTKDGGITAKGCEAAGEILWDFFRAYSNEQTFGDITEDVLSTFHEYQQY